MITQGKWRANPWGNGKYYVAAPNAEVAIVNALSSKNGSAEDNARMIAAAVNACQSINPQNPMAVAEALPDMLAQLKWTIDILHRVFEEHGTEYVKESYMMAFAEAAIQRAQGKE